MTQESTSLSEVLRVGVIQTSLHADAAWIDDGSGNWRQCVRMSLIEELRAKKEIRHYLASLRGLDSQPGYHSLARICGASWI